MRDTDGAKTNLTCEVPMHGYKYCMHGLASLLKSKMTQKSWDIVASDRIEIVCGSYLCFYPNLYCI